MYSSSFKEEIECIVCFTNYDDEEHRPRVLQCGHTICSHCLARAIRERSKTCPKCRKHYIATNLKDLPVNFSFEGLLKKKQKVDESLPNCAEHQLQVSHRCSTHKAWVCNICIRDDHSLESCTIIEMSEVLRIKKTELLNKSQPLLHTFEETCKTIEDNKKKCTKVTKDINDDINQCETMIRRLKEEIKRKEDSKKQMEKRNALFDEKLKLLKGKRNHFDEAVTLLKSSETIIGVSKCSLEVTNLAEKLQSISQDIKNEVDQVLQTFDVTDETCREPSVVNHKVSIRKSKYHLHCLQNNDSSKLASLNLKFTDENAPALTDGILTFLDIAWPGKEPRRVYMKTLGNTARARQHILLCTGYSGISYKEFSFNTFKIINEGQPGEIMTIAPLDVKSREPLLKDVQINSRIITSTPISGMMAGVITEGNTNNNACAFYFTDVPATSPETFGTVAAGLDVLKDVAKSYERAKIKIVDCGVIVVC